MANKKIMSNNELLSNTISFLRFPLIVGVVFIHNIMGSVMIQGKEIRYGDIWPWLNVIMDTISIVLASISVPLFFFISGYYFFKGDFNKVAYKEKIWKRCNTLLVPYLIWNFIGFLILLIQMHPRFLSLFPLLRDYRIDITEFLSYFWIKELPMDPPGERAAPIDYPMWFVRDLMLLALASPLIYWLIRKLKLFFIALLGVIWFFGLARYVGLPYLCHQSVFFFPLGAYFGIFHLDFVEMNRKGKWLLFVYPFLAICDLLTIGEANNYWFHNFGILIGMVTAVYIAYYLLQHNKAQINKFLSDASFFVFAAHALFLTKFMKALVMTIQPQSPFVVLLIYFFVPIATIFICLGLYKLLNRWMPSVAKVVTGGR